MGTPFKLHHSIVLKKWLLILLIIHDTAHIEESSEQPLLHTNTPEKKACTMNIWRS